jgi:hypothetical protein
LLPSDVSTKQLQDFKLNDLFEFPESNPGKPFIVDPAADFKYNFPLFKTVCISLFEYDCAGGLVTKKLIAVVAV